MEHEEVHELTAAYALDALSEEEEAELEAHMRHCERCRGELASFRDTAADLAFGVSPAAPPPYLRERILTIAREERGKVVPLRTGRTLRTLTAVAALALVGLGTWAVIQSVSLSDERAARGRLESAVDILADPTAQRFPLRGGEGALVRGSSGAAVLLVKELDPAPEGRTYEAWVNVNGAMSPAGIFDATGATTVVMLDRTLPSGAGIAVTIEPAGGLKQPSGKPIMTAEPA